MKVNQGELTRKISCSEMIQEEGVYKAVAAPIQFRFIVIRDSDDYNAVSVLRFDPATNALSTQPTGVGWLNPHANYLFEKVPASVNFSITE